MKQFIFCLSPKKIESMKANHICIFIAILLAVVCLNSSLTSCRSSKEVTENQGNASAGMAEAYKKQVVTKVQTAAAITARMKIELNASGKSLSANGTLRMKRNEVVQMSISMLGFEVARMEFSPSGVLLIDRFNKQYVNAAYGDVSFLKQAGLDFYALQALMWNELFVPGQTEVLSSLQRFRLNRSGEHTLLTLDDTPKLNYRFQTLTSTARINQVDVSPKSAADKESFQWTYAEFNDFNGNAFPTQMQCAIKALGKEAGFSLKLSRLDNNADWESHTKVSSKYRQRSVNEILGRLLSL